jgi:hypothetical protein
LTDLFISEITEGRDGIVCRHLNRLVTDLVNEGRPLFMAGSPRKFHEMLVGAAAASCPNPTKPALLYRFPYRVIGPIEGTSMTPIPNKFDHTPFSAAMYAAELTLSEAAAFERDHGGEKCGIIWRRPPSVRGYNGIWVASTRLAFVPHWLAEEIVNDPPDPWVVDGFRLRYDGVWIENAPPPFDLVSVKAA